MKAGHSIRHFSAWGRFVNLLFVDGTRRHHLTKGQWQEEVVAVADMVNS